MTCGIDFTGICHGFWGVTSLECLLLVCLLCESFAFLSLPLSSLSLLCRLHFVLGVHLNFFYGDDGLHTEVDVICCHFVVLSPLSNPLVLRLCAFQPGCMGWNEMHHIVVRVGDTYTTNNRIQPNSLGR